MNNNLQNKTIIYRPRVTEKSSLINSANVYAFEVDSAATKKDIEREIQNIYKVVPIKINIARSPRKTVMYKGRPGKTKAIKKAYVYLEAGDKIDI